MPHAPQDRCFNACVPEPTTVRLASITQGIALSREDERRGQIRQIFRVQRRPVFGGRVLNIAEVELVRFFQVS